MLLPITLTIAGAAALINLWLALRIVAIRRREKILMGDGAHPLMLARMRAQANFVEYAPFVLILIGVIEFAIGPSPWLWAAGAIFIAVRIAHAIGMDGWLPGRMAGTAITFAMLVILGLWAIALPVLAARTQPAATVTVPPPRA